MSFEATISRKKALSAASTAVEKVNELVARHEETITEVARIRNGLAGLEQHANKRLDAQGAMINACETRHTAIAHEVSRVERDLDARIITALAEEAHARNQQIVELARRLEAFEQMGVFARLWWVLTGITPTLIPATEGDSHV